MQLPGLTRRNSIRLSQHLTWASCLLLHSVALFSTSVGGEGASAKPRVPPRVAIIGSGVAAASAAYFLRDTAGPDWRIDVIAQETSASVVGGRLGVAKFDGRWFESGGSIIHDKNLYMKHFADQLGLTRLYHSEETRLAVYNGRETVLDTSDWYIVKMAQLLHRYGLSAFVHLSRFVTAMLRDFGRVYARQNAGQAFTSVRGLLASMSDSFPEMAAESIEKLLLDRGFDAAFINELVAGAMRNNYGQNVSIHGFVGAVSLAGAEGGLWSVRGGNRLIVGNLLERLAKQSAASSQPDSFRLLLGRRVTRVAKADSGWLVSSVNSSSSGAEDQDSENVTERYDQVILTVPAHQQFDIQFVGADVPRLAYQSTVATFVKGALNHAGLGLASRQEQYSLLTGTPVAPLDFNSIGYQYDVEGVASDGVYKVFSQRPLTSDQLDKLFVKIDATRSVSWLAYPLYLRGTSINASFVLAGGLYHTSPVELAASAMETSAIAGRNAALLAFNDWTGRSAESTDPRLDVDGRPKPQDHVSVQRVEL